jgi:hypothetical protein
VEPLRGKPVMISGLRICSRSIALEPEAVHQHAGQISERRDATHEVQAGLGLQ